MKRNPALRFVVLSLLLIASAPAGAKAYKCIVDGKTVFQDHPCAAPAPAASAPAPTATVAAPPAAQRSPEQIFDEIQIVERHLRELETTHQAEAKVAEHRLAAMDAKAREAERQQMEARWRQPVRVQQQKLDRLQTELHTRCPGGAGARSGRFECLP